jgi:hypothetical protein
MIRPAATAVSIKLERPERGRLRHPPSDLSSTLYFLTFYFLTARSAVRYTADRSFTAVASFWTLFGSAAVFTSPVNCVDSCRSVTRR